MFINDLIDNNQVMQSTWQTGVANARLEFSGEGRFQISTQKMAVRKHQIFCQFQTEIIKANGFRQNIALSTHWPPTNKLFGSLDWPLMLETNGIGKSEISTLRSLLSILSKNQSHEIYDVYLQSAKFAPVWTTILKIRVIFVHQILTEHAL